jgi:hypothetical protein
MVDDDNRPRQKTKPRGKDEHGKTHKPVEIPVPKREDFAKLLRRAAKPPKKS